MHQPQPQLQINPPQTPLKRFWDTRYIAQHVNGIKVYIYMLFDGCCTIGIFKKQVVESNIPSISRRVFLDLAGSVAKAFEGSGEGPTFTDPMRHAVIHDALEMLLTPPKDREQKAQAIFSKEFRDGSKAEQALLDTRALNKPRISTKAKQQNTEGAFAALNHANCISMFSLFVLWLSRFSERKCVCHETESCRGDVNFVDEILSDLIFTVYLRLNEKNEKNEKSKTQSHVNAGRRMQAWSKIGSRKFVYYFLTPLHGWYFLGVPELSELS